MRARNRLSAAFVKRAPAGKWCDGAGLWLAKRPDGGTPDVAAAPQVLPVPGRIPVSDIDRRDVRDALARIWHGKAQVARTALDRPGRVLKHAAAPGLGEKFQAAAKACALLGRSRHQARHIRALPSRDVPALHAGLAEPTPTHAVLRLFILTGGRPAPLRCMRPDQLDGDAGTNPGAAMKGRVG